MIIHDNICIPEIVEKWLKEHKFDGLSNAKNKCYCRVDDPDGMIACEDFTFMYRCAASRWTEGEDGKPVMTAVVFRKRNESELDKLIELVRKS